MHMVINTPTNEVYRNLADSCSRKEWNEIDVNEFNNIKYKGIGIENFIYDLLIS